MGEMDYTTYKIIHLAGISALAIGTGGMLANGNNRKVFAMWQGAGLVIMLVSGFGLLAKLKLGFPHFAMVKALLWVVMGCLPFIFRKLRPPLSICILIPILLVAVMAWLGIVKPPLW